MHKKSKRLEDYLEHERQHMSNLCSKVKTIGDIDKMNELNVEHEVIVKNIVEKIPSIRL